MAQFAQVAELRDLLQGSFELVDPQAVLLLESASAAIQSYCRQRIEFKAADEVSLRGSWEAVLQLPERPVTAVSSVAVAGATVGTDSYYWNRRGEVRWGQPTDGELALSGLWGGPDVDIAVTYSHGFDPIPEDIRAVCLLLASALLANPGGAASESIGDYSVTYLSQEALGFIGPAERLILDRYSPVRVTSLSI